MCSIWPDTMLSWSLHTDSTGLHWGTQRTWLSRTDEEHCSSEDDSSMQRGGNKKIDTPRCLPLFSSNSHTCTHSERGGVCVFFSISQIWQVHPGEQRKTVFLSDHRKYIFVTWVDLNPRRVWQNFPIWKRLPFLEPWWEWVHSSFNSPEVVQALWAPGGTSIEWTWFFLPWLQPSIRTELG